MRKIIGAGLAVAVLAAAVSTAGALAQAAERDAVRLAALDYVEGVYNVQPDRIRRSVHPSLVKRGFYKKDAAAPYIESAMTFDELVTLAETWNRDGKRDTSIKEVIVLDVLDQTAAAKVVASWGVDYMLLARHEGRWKIQQILWQSPPPRATR